MGKTHRRCHASSAIIAGLMLPVVAPSVPTIAGPIIRSTIVRGNRLDVVTSGVATAVRTAFCAVARDASNSLSTSKFLEEMTKFAKAVKDAQIPLQD